MNPVIEQMLAHRSIRKFTDDPVHEADMKMKGTDHEN